MTSKKPQVLKALGDVCRLFILSGCQNIWNSDSRWMTTNYGNEEMEESKAKVPDTVIP